MHHPVGFRCKTCGHLHAAEHAGENELPHACAVCGAGVEFNRQGIKTYQPKNWEVLADATEERLAELGLEPHHVERHVPFEKGKGPEREPQVITREVSEGLASEDKG